jgi:hypothetical protein
VKRHPDLLSAESVARAALAAHIQGDWHKLASLVEPISLDEWRRGFVESNTRVRSIDDWQTQFPNVPPERLEQLAEPTAVRVRAFVAHLSEHVVDVHTLEDLERLDSAEVLERVLQGMDPIDRLNRFTAAAYLAAGIPRPASAYHARRSRVFSISRRRRVSENRIRISFHEEGTANRSAWTIVRQPSGEDRLLMSPNVLYLPGGHVNYIDDPVVLRFHDQQRG